MKELLEGFFFETDRSSFNLCIVDLALGSHFYGLISAKMHNSLGLAVIASEAKQSRSFRPILDCFGAHAPRND
jgi:hypothetical protein